MTGTPARPSERTAASPFTQPTSTTTAAGIGFSRPRPIALVGRVNRLPCCRIVRVVTVESGRARLALLTTPFSHFSTIGWYGAGMALNIKDPETERLAGEIAALTGESKTGAIRT